MKNAIIIFTLLSFLWSCTDDTKEDIQSIEKERPELVEKEGAEIASDSMIHCSGEIAVLPEAIYSIHSPVGGLIKSIHTSIGEQVRKGEVLAFLEHLSIIQLQEDYLAAKSTFNHAAKTYERKAKLFEQGIISDKEYEESEQMYGNAFAHYEGLKSRVTFLNISLNKLNQGKIQKSVPIYAPVNGSIASVAVQNGQYAAQDTELFTLIDDSKKHVQLKVFAADAGKIFKGQKIWIKTADENKRYEAEVYLISKMIEEGKNTIVVHGRLLEESNELVVGTFVFAEIKM